MSSHELLETALRVLVAWTGGNAPTSGDAEALLREYPASRGLPLDELACRIVHDLGARPLPKPVAPEKDGPEASKVA